MLETLWKTKKRRFVCCFLLVGGLLVAGLFVVGLLICGLLFLVSCCSFLLVVCGCARFHLQCVYVKRRLISVRSMPDKWMNIVLPELSNCFG